MTGQTPARVEPKEVAQLHYAAAGSLLVALAFLALFQVGKVSPFREVNPFGEDPYDAVGSIAVQLALFCAVLSYARMIRVLRAPHEITKGPLVVRGNILVLGSVLVTLVADAFAEASNRAPQTTSGAILLLGLVALGILGVASAILVVRAASAFSLLRPPTDLTPADAIDDFWGLLRIPLQAIDGLLPTSVTKRLQEVRSDLVFAPFPWLNPRLHPWRFTVLAGVSAGLLLLALQLREGIPPDLPTALAVVAIFVSVEVAAILAGYAVFGRFLGLRPSPSREDLSA